MSWQLSIDFVCEPGKMTFVLEIFAFNSKNLLIRLGGYKGHWIKRENHSQTMKLSQFLIKTERKLKRKNVQLI